MRYEAADLNAGINTALNAGDISLEFDSYRAAHKSFFGKRPNLFNFKILYFHGFLSLWLMGMKAPASSANDAGATTNLPESFQAHARKSVIHNRNAASRLDAIICGLACLVLLLCVAGAAHGLWEGWERLIVALYGEKPV